MATLTLNNVKKAFGRIEVIHGIDASIVDGEFVVIVGPSGCGKSTLLRMVAGLETVTEGEVLINDEPVNHKEPMDRDIAMVFQNYALYPHMSVRQNMAYGLKIQKIPKQDINQKVEAAAELLQLSEFLDRKPKQLSGGQRQRVAMGRAIVREPAVFLFDEPLSNLDAKLRVQMRLEIKQLQAKLGVTSLYVTHDQVEAMTMADRMIVMNNGVAEQIGSPLEVYEQPTTLFAAQFIGSPAMNVYSGHIDSGTLTLDGNVKIAVPSAHQGPITVGIRPEHFVLDENGGLAFDVTYAEPLGATTLLHGSMVGSEVGSNTSMSVSIPGVYRMANDGSVDRLRLTPQQIHLFHSESGKRLS